MTEWTKEEDEAFNEVEKQSNLGKQILRDLGQPYYFKPAKYDDDDIQDYVRPWKGLTNEERNKLWREVVGWGDPSHDDEDLMKAIEAKLKEKNR
jgi:hypothetical protein